MGESLLLSCGQNSKCAQSHETTLAPLSPIVSATDVSKHRAAELLYSSSRLPLDLTAFCTSAHLHKLVCYILKGWIFVQPSDNAFSLPRKSSTHSIAFRTKSVSWVLFRRSRPISHCGFGATIERYVDRETLRPTMCDDRAVQEIRHESREHRHCRRFAHSAG